MAISGNLSVAATLASYHPSPSSTLSSKVDFTCFMNGRSSFSGITLKWTGMTMNGRNIHDQTKGLAGILGVSDEAKQKIVKNIVRTPSDFVEMGVKRQEHQEVNGAGTITNIEYKDTGERSGCIDVKFDFYVPDE
ncbi:hypothetical protein Goshw_010745 [Gossypium schwendimanii]|uniref:Uncharacterized protein n=1 Tax=Gossypium schwendimanii TaxID=34291 RepID=A0A7J9L989_GOSSC|nr:hypothetical protein [Gossypium schwendimanii]